MLNNFFGKSNPINLTCIFVIFVIFFLVNFAITNPFDSISFSLVGYQFLNFLLFSLIFFYYNFILSKNKLTLHNSYGFLLFVLLFGFYPETMSNSDGIVLNFILILFLRKVFSFSKSGNFYKKMVDSGFWLGIFFLIEPPSVIFGLLIFVSVWLFDKLTLRAFLIPLTGFLVPLICYATYHYHSNTTNELVRLFSWYSKYDFKIYDTPSVLFSFIFLGSLTVISIIFKLTNFFSTNPIYRKNWMLVALNGLLAGIFFTIKDNHQDFEVMILFFSISILITNWLERFKGAFQKDLLILLLLIGSVISFAI